MDKIEVTPFRLIYESFFSKITDDLYLELTRADTERDAQTILLSAIPKFEFPRFPIFNYDTKLEFTDENGDKSYGAFLCVLHQEEINILAEIMVCEWLARQIYSVESIRMKYAGSDFKISSQANHLDKLVKTNADKLVQLRHIQRLYKRRKVGPDGRISSNLSGLGGGVLK